MNRSTTRASRTHHALALGLGLFLGHATMLMAQQREGSLLAFALATVFIVASSASFVLFVLGQRDGVPTSARIRQSYGLIGAIGIGVLVSLQAIELLA